MFWTVMALLTFGVFLFLGSFFLLILWLINRGEEELDVWAWLIAVVLLVFAVGSGIIGYYNIPDKRTQESLLQLIGAVSGPSILAGWVQVVPGNQDCAPMLGTKTPPPDPQVTRIGKCAPEFSVRAVVEAKQDCPSVTINGNTKNPIYLNERRGFDSYGGSRRVKVCQYRLKEGTENVALPGRNPISVKTRHLNSNRPPQKIVFLGDTGCRGRANKQDCTGQDWPFKSVANEAADENPDLVVHLGDYMYTGEDDWDDWNRYFLEPARSLLDAAPWIFVRGNHERCSEDNHWRGFDLFFGDTPQMPCKDGTGKYLLELARPYAVDLSPDLRLIVADSASAFASKNADRTMTQKWPLNVSCPTSTLRDTDKKKQEAKAAEEAVCQIIIQVLSNVARLASVKDGNQVWLTTHVPVFGIERKPGANPENYVPESSAMMLAAWRVNPVNGLDLILSGDRHLYQMIELHSGTSNQLKQVAVGTAGVLLDDLPYAASDPVEAQLNTADFSALFNVNRGCSYKGHGYLIAEWGSGSSKYNWSFRPWNISQSSYPKTCPPP